MVPLDRRMVLIVDKSHQERLTGCSYRKHAMPACTRWIFVEHNKKHWLPNHEQASNMICCCNLKWTLQITTGLVNSRDWTPVKQCNKKFNHRTIQFRNEIQSRLFQAINFGGSLIRTIFQTYTVDLSWTSPAQKRRFSTFHQIEVQDLPSIGFKCAFCLKFSASSHSLPFRGVIKVH